MTRSNIRRAALTAAAGVAALGLSACGGGGGGGGAPISPPAPPPPPPPPPPPTAVPGDFETPEYFEQYGLALINASTAYASDATGAGITVAVIDTGVDLDHPELVGNISPLSTDITGAGRTAEDADGHGTGVAGVIAAAKDDLNFHGVAFESSVMAIRADAEGSCEVDGGDGCLFTDVTTAAAIDYARERGARIINLSLGRSSNLADGSTLTFAAMRRATSAGVLLVVSAGNQGEDEDDPPASPNFPANFVNDAQARGLAVAVGSVGETAVISDFSARAGDEAQAFYLVAPGERIVTTFRDGQFALFGGTSFSAPHVAGALALLLDAFPSLDPADALELLLDTAQDLGDPGLDPIYGSGLIDLAAAFQPSGTTTLDIGGLGPVVLGRSLSAPTGAAGDWVWTSGLLDGAIMRDEYDRAYRFDPGGPDDVADASLGAMQAAAEASLRRTTVVDAGLAAVSLRQGPGGYRALTNLPEEVYAPDTDVAFSLRFDNTVIEAGRGFSAPPALPGAGVSVLSETVFSGALANLAAERDWAAIRWDGEHVSFAVRTSGSNDSAFSAAAASLKLGEQRLGLEVGAAQEADGVLGSRLAWRFGREDAAVSRFAALVWNGPVNAGPLGEWRAAARLEAVSADAALPQHFESTGDITASAWSVGADRAVRFGSRAGVLGLTISQPLRIEDGAVTASIPVEALADGATLFERRTASLVPSGREIAMEAAWRTQLRERVDVSVAARFTQDPGHVAQADDEALIWAGLRTRF